MPVSISGSGPITGLTSINTTVSDTELGYLDGVTSAIQTQFNGLGTWQTWTPVLTQGSTVACTVNYAKYTRIGKLVIATAYLTASGTGTAGNNVSISLPVSNAVGSIRVGSGSIYYSPTGTSYAAIALLGTGSVLFVGDWSGGAGWGTTPSLAVAVSDQYTFTATYEAA